MLSLLFSANYPGAGAPFWRYFGASLDHFVLALCFVALLIGGPEAGGVLWPTPRSLGHEARGGTGE